MEERKPSSRKVREGVVISSKMDKTVTVRVERRMRHPQLQKVVLRGKKFYAHHDGEPIPVGTKVRITETRPLSKLKRWRVEQVVA